MTCSRKRGIALLLVLASLVMVTGVLGLLTLSAAQTHRASQLVINERRADDLLRSCEPVVTEWLAKHAPRAAVDPESSEPKVEIASIEWTASDGTECFVRAAAWDLLGMLPPETNSSTPLWLAVDPLLRDFERGDAGSMCEISSAPVSVYPLTDEYKLALGSQLSIYPRSDSRRTLNTPTTPTTPTININTAPRPLLETALRLAQRGDIASILTARADGRPAPAPPRIADDGESFVELTGRSTLWAVRTDAAANGLRRSWWTVYESRRGGWEIIERHAIGE